MLSLEAVPLGTRLLNAVVVYRLYVQKAAFPTTLVAFYPHPGSGLDMGDVVISAVFLVGITVLAGLNARRRPYLIVGWLWYLGTLVPMIGLVQLSGQQMADRYTYLPLLGCYVAIAWLAASLATQLRMHPQSLRRLRAWSSSLMERLDSYKLATGMTASACFDTTSLREKRTRIP